MPLQKQLISIPFAEGLDTKTDAKKTPAGKLTTAENVAFDKAGMLTRRRGHRALAKDIEATGAITACEGVATYQDELLMFDGGSIYSYAEATERWMRRAAAVCVEADERGIVRNNYAQSNPDHASLNGMRVIAWEDGRGGVRYSVLDETTGTLLVNDASVSTSAARPRVVVHQNEFAIFYVSGANMRYRRINPVTPRTIATAANPVTTMHATNNHYDVVEIGTRCFIAFNNTVNNIIVTYLDETWSTFGTPVTLVPTGGTPQCLTLFTDVSLNVWVAYGTTTITQTARWSYALTSAAGPWTVEGTASVRISGAWVVAYDSVSLFYEITGATPDKARVHTAAVLFDGTVLATFAVARSVGLVGRVIVDETNALVYALCAHESEEQATDFLIADSGAIVARSAAGEAGGLRTTSTVSNTIDEGDRRFSYAVLRKGRMETESGWTYTRLGVSLASYDFTVPGRWRTVEAGGSLLVAGGVLQMYDGASFVEHGFHLYPEGATSSTSGGFAISVTTQGTGAVAEVTSITCIAGSRIRSGQYFWIYSATDATKYRVWFNVDGLGDTLGNVGYPISTAVEVPVGATDSAADVAVFLSEALNNTGDFNAVPVGAVVTCTNTAIGVTTDASNEAAPNGVGTGSLTGGGAYQYCFTYEWTDRTGRVHRSAPSTPISVTAVANLSVSLTVPTLRLTGKSDVRVVVYRTLAGQTTFYRTSTFGTVANSKNVDSITFVDISTDAIIRENDYLYTTGDNLANLAPNACTAIATRAGRVYLSGFSDPYAFAYSKQVIEGEPVAFAGEFRQQVDPTGGSITALLAMDDKTIIFKERAVFVHVGDGPNDAGQQSDFGEPQMVTNDVGCVDPSSAVLTPAGVFFKSSKGFYLLDRSLSVTYVGAAVEDWNAYEVTGAALVPDSNRVLFVTGTGPAIVYDYYFQQWSTFTNHESVGCTVWLDQFVFGKSDGTVYVADQTKHADGDHPYRMKAVRAWWSFAGMAGFKRLYEFAVLADYKGGHRLRVQVGFDFCDVFSEEKYFDAETEFGGSTFGSDTPFGSGSPFGGEWPFYLVRFQQAQQLCSSFRISVEEVQTEDYNEALTLSEIACVVGVKKGLANLRASRSLGTG